MLHGWRQNILFFRNFQNIENFQQKNTKSGNFENFRKKTQKHWKLISKIWKISIFWKFLKIKCFFYQKKFKHDLRVGIRNTVQKHTEIGNFVFFSQTWQVHETLFFHNISIFLVAERKSDEKIFQNHIFLGVGSWGVGQKVGIFLIFNGFPE